MKYDVIVVGGGSAGSVVAARMAEDPDTTVLLLEAGTDYPDLANLPEDIQNGHTRTAEDERSEHNWALRGTITEEQGEIHVAQGKVIGGGGSINGQVFLRGIPQDFDDWASWGNEEWSYTKVLPYFRKAETDLDIKDDFHGTDGPLPISRKVGETWPVIQSAFHTACLQNGFDTTDDMNGVEPTGVGVVPMNNQKGVRMSTAITHLAPMRHHLNLTIRGNVFARKILIENRQVTGVEVESGGEVFTVESNKVVLSAGALKSPHILMLSGIGPKDQLDEYGIDVLQNTPGVGANLRNHPISPISFRVKEGIKLQPDASGVRIALRYTAKGSDDSNDMMMTTSSLFSPFTGEMLPDRIGRISCVIELPAGAGFVRLNSADPAVQPKFDYRYFSHPEDMRRMRDGIRLAVKMLETDAYKDVSDGRVTPTEGILTDDDALDLWIRQTVGSARHVSGTCKIGPDSDPMAVVDQQCRVKGLQGLWIADSSVMPQVPRANANATAIMIGERVAEWAA
ncbi:MAG: mycofactocin system GMC family oxidoreductase MftG [SAR202 cluster bacterium]|uniref:Glucose-methanol-choline oxidoreductase N-terminal domain-containing protein n=1 Tax=marine metagenome TaxID=408172 RepID=A0A381PXC3_9ZZZZ|nr:mycofactocin system GMC family oxidoreductase MftG [Dehalococcoidia bacterium]MED5588262.1 mycofactocin system GMC family oxidoreductase MftG [Chloroflexota bacterium]MQG12972.1 mycofactocin system GMC family oxidoreductase MftG [SAR202 cluster bacterium]MQG71357.1 mycofactocin system GMC family oxidoreductase MftG [SAR202 cluster bacterium]|tara:strand:+ start:985 stop:2514 length:1530 start_codon:yes stop_codon:yes gene_type:complete